MPAVLLPLEASSVPPDTVDSIITQYVNSFDDIDCTCGFLIRHCVRVLTQRQSNLYCEDAVYGTNKTVSKLSCIVLVTLAVWALLQS